jgi:hypothetical protein
MSQTSQSGTFSGIVPPHVLQVAQADGGWIDMSWAEEAHREHGANRSDLSRIKTSDGETVTSQSDSKQLHRDCHGGANPLDLRSITDTINLHKVHSAHCYNAHCVCVLGNSGAGKTTFANYVAGRKVVKIMDKSGEYIQHLDVENPLEGFVVGHGGDSMTRYLRSIKIDPVGNAGSDLVLVDTPGSGDTEGHNVDIANAVAISWAIRQSKSARLVLLINAGMFEEPRGGALCKLLQLFNRFLVNSDANLDSVKQT